MSLKNKIFRKYLEIKNKISEMKHGPVIRLSSEKQKLIEVIRMYLKDEQAEVLMSPENERMIKVYDGMYRETYDPEILLYICDGSEGTKIHFCSMMIVNHGYHKMYDIPIEVYLQLEDEFNNEIRKRRRRLFDMQIEKSEKHLDKILNKKL